MRSTNVFYLGFFFVTSITLVAALFIIRTIGSPQVAPIIRDSTVDKGEVVTLYKNSVIRVKNTTLTFSIKNFINSPCPQGAQCLWTGKKVVLEMLKNNLPVEDRSHIFTFTVVASDYETYANILVGTVFDECITNNNKTSCADLAKLRFTTPSDCENAIGVLNVFDCKEILN